MLQLGGYVAALQGQEVASFVTTGCRGAGRGGDRARGSRDVSIVFELIQPVGAVLLG